MSATPLPANGLVITTAEVIPAWLDYNEHMNVTYYLVAFETGIEAYKHLVGLTPAYIAGRRRSTVALEAHITYQREASLGDRLRIETRVLDCDGKRAHVYQEMYRDDLLLSVIERTVDNRYENTKLFIVSRDGPDQPLRVVRRVH